MTSLSASSYLFSFQRYEFTYRTFEKLISWPLFFGLCCFFLFILTLLLFYYFLYLHHLFPFWSSFFSFFCFFYFYFFTFSSFFSFSFCSCYSGFPCFGFHTLLDILSFLLPLSFSQFQDCSK